MALLRFSRYPGRFAPANALQPQGAFINRSAPEAKDGTYLERDWANDWSGFFSALLVNANITPNGLVDNATASQYFDAMSLLINKAIQDTSGVTTGMICHFAMTTPPAGFLKANGAAVKRADFPALFAKIGTTYGSGDGATTFNLPDARGRFHRSLDDGAGIDPGRGIGSVQASQNLSHTHTATTDSQGAHAHTVTTTGAGGHNHSASTDSQGNHEHQMGFGRVTPDGIDNVGSNEPFNPTMWGSHYRSFNTSPAGSHAHNVSIGAVGDHAHSGSTNTVGAHAHNVTVAANGGNEARPNNIAWLACIKF